MTTKSIPNLDALATEVAEAWRRAGCSGALSRTAAAELAEMTRYLNRATLDAPAQAIPDPTTNSAVLWALATMVGRLPQLLNQLAARQEQLGRHPNIAAAHSDPQEITARTATLLRSSLAPAIEQAAATLKQAATAADQLYLDE